MYQKFRKLQKYSNPRKCEIVENWRHCRHALQLHHLPGAHSEHQENLPSSSNHIHVWLCQVSKGKLHYTRNCRCLPPTPGSTAAWRATSWARAQAPPTSRSAPPPAPPPPPGWRGQWWWSSAWGRCYEHVMTTANMRWTMQQRVGAICRGRSWWPPNDSSDVMADTRWMDASISRD